MTFYSAVWYFFIYAFLGWCTEVSFFAVRKGKFVNRGFLNGPVCPIYGEGITLIIILLTPLQDNLLVLFAGSVIVTSALEYVTGWALEKIFHTRWWDYSENKFNLGGYICLQFSLAWGLAATFVMKIIQPMVAGFVDGFPKIIGIPLLIFFAAVIIVDAVATVAAVRNMQKSLRLITSMAAEVHGFSDMLGEKVYGTAISVKEQTEETVGRYSELTELCKAHREEEQSLSEVHRKEEQEVLEKILALEKQRLGTGQEQLKKELSEKLSGAKKRFGRLLRAFPELRSNDYQEALEKLRKHEK